MSEKNSHKIPRLPGLHSLQVFEVAARHQSFVQAASELYVTHGAVSRQIRQLEDQLGLPLFERRNRAVFLTPAGQKLSVACKSALADIRQVIQEIAAPTSAAPLVVSCEPTIAMRWLIPRLPRFRARYPDIQLHLLAAGGPINFVRDRVDVALRRSDFKWPDEFHVDRIANEWMGPVCTPELAMELERSGFAAFRELHVRTRPHAWSLWRRHSGVDLPIGHVDFFEHFYLSLQAAHAGLGVAMGSRYMVEEDIHDGRLVAPYGFTADQSEYVLLSPVPIESDLRRFHFSEWVRYEMQVTACKL